MSKLAHVLSYPVVVEDQLLDRAGELVLRHAPAHTYAVITDENVGRLYGDRVIRSFGRKGATLFVMQPGETAKTVTSWWDLSESMLRAGFGRDSAVVALGGGIVGDVAGFVAATYMRGVPYVQMPTTVVAMVDSSIGGKTGVNSASGKNMLGAFHQPRAVLADTSTLSTLPERELRAGFAEVIKHGVIADAEYFARVSTVLPEILTTSGAHPAMKDIITRSVEIKGSVVARDERESGLRKILNFGHTIGHAIEALSNYQMLHGEAISIGMCLESVIAERFGAARNGTTEQVRAALNSAGLPTLRPNDMTPEAILAAAATDKKARAGEVEFALPADIGGMAGEMEGWSLRVPRELVLAAIQ